MNIHLLSLLSSTHKEKCKRSPAKSTNSNHSLSSKSPLQTKIIVREEQPADVSSKRSLALVPYPKGSGKKELWHPMVNPGTSR